MMKRILVLASIALGSAAFAQSPPDVPENHWASKAVADLYRLGVLKGYPDGLFRGTRPASRYEMAQAIHDLYQVSENSTDGLASQLRQIRNGVLRVEDVRGLADMRKRLDALETDVSGLQALQPEVKDLSKRFESLLEQLAKIREDVRIMRNKRQ
jgi:hypothetical protein